jgi:ubiquitin carboxyl-terminal hydrolase 14
MGTAEGKELKDLDKKIVFIEDLTPEERARLLKEKTGEVNTAGLVNLGNTCYMNSVVQNLKKVKELSESVLKAQPDPSVPEVTSYLVQSTKKMFN